MNTRGGIWGFLLVLLISLGIIFFLGTEVNPTTGASKRIFTSDGINHFRKGMDVAGGVRLTYKIDLSKYKAAYPNPQEYSTVVKGVKDIILKNIDARVSALGVSDSNTYIQSLSDGEYLVVEIGGVFDLEQAKEIIGKTVELEFKIPYEGGNVELEAARKAVAEDILKSATANPSTFAELAAGKAGDNIYYQRYTATAKEDLPSIYAANAGVFNDREAGSVYGTLLEGVYQDAPVLSGVDTSSFNALEGYVIVKTNGATVASGSDTLYDIEEIFVNKAPQWIPAKDPKSGQLLNGAFFQQASVGASQTGVPVVEILFDETGKEIFCNLTEQIVGKQMAIFVGGQLTTAPVIREKICGGSAQIDGDFTGEPCGTNQIPAESHPAGTRCLVDNLNEGALPAQLILANEEKVSASLGEKALRGAMIAGIVGLSAIYLFMIFMYGFRQGTVALLTLVGFLIILFAVIKLFNSALSLSGIAAILLSIGMGVDANVLIYERVREELALSKSMDNSIIDGYNRSWTAIRDGNVTTLMIAFLLLMVGTNVFKGFGTMMVINILITLFFVVPFTKALLLAFYNVKR